MFKDLLELKLETVIILVSLILLSIIFLVLMRKGKERFDTKLIVYAGLAISLAFVLSSIKIFSMPQGGTVTPASMLPLFIFSFIFGPLAGIAVGALYGFLQLLQSGYIVHWAQLIIDYPLAFAAIGTAGFFRKFKPAGFPIGIIVGSTLRLFFHFLSGVIFFSEYAPESQGPVLYSLAYNGSFMLIETVITVLLSIPIISVLQRNRRLG